LKAEQVKEIIQQNIKDNEQRRLELDDSTSKLEPTIYSINNELYDLIEDINWIDGISVDKETALMSAIEILTKLGDELET